MVLKNAAMGVKVLIVASGAFFAGSIGWSVVSGIIGGLLDSVGIVIAGSTYLMVAPIVGIVVAGWAVNEVTG